jgi:predicted metalloendopeptidase
VVPLVKNPMLPSKSQVRLQEISGLTDSEMAQIMATVNKVKPMLPEDDDDDAGNNANAAHRMLFRCHPHPRATVHSIDNLHRAAGKNLVRDVLAAMNLGDFKSYHSDGVAESGEKLAELQLDELKNVMKYVVMARDADLMPASSAADNDKQRQTAIRWLVKLEASPLVFYLSHLFDKTVSPENREATKKMADEFRTAFRERMEKLTWLTDAGKAKALEKLEAMRVVLGWLDTEHPEWLSKTPQSGNFYDDVNELFRQSLEVRKQLIGMQTDDAFMYALSVDFPSYEPNAMYSSVCNMVVINTINMTAPTYLGDKSDAYNLALLGATIGHEMTHGFDDNGSKFDKTGQEIAWLDAESNANFEKLQQLQIDNFDRLTYWPDYDCNGKRTLTENIADLGGLCIAYDVLMKRLAAQGVTDAERDFQAREFFRAFAFSWMENIDQKQANKYRLQDIHAAGCLRVNGNVYLMDEFYRVFNITKGKMYLSPEKRFLIW